MVDLYTWLELYVQILTAGLVCGSIVGALLYLYD